MKWHHVAWGLVIAGAVVSLAEGVAIADSNSTGVPFEQSAIGKIETAIPNPTPLQPGTILLIAGSVVFVVLHFKKK